MNLHSRKAAFSLAALLLLVVVIAALVGGCSGSGPTAAPTSSAPAPAKTSAPPAATTAPPATSAPAPATTSALAPPAAGGQPIVWRAVTMGPRNQFTMRNIGIIADRLKTQSNGQFTIQYLGGPEVVPAMNQAIAVQQNVIQVAVVSMSNYDGIVPVGNMLDLSDLTPAEEHASGAYDYVNQYHAKAGLYYLERGTSIKDKALHSLILKQSIDKPQQLAGKKIGMTTNVIDTFMRTVGGTPVIVPAPDAYTALERGIVDGFTYPITNSADSQLFEVTKYVLDHPFYRGAVAIIVNLDTWNKLPANYQKMIKDISAQVMVEYMDALDKEINVARQKATDKGLKFIKFSDADAQWFYKTLYDSGWSDVSRKMGDAVAAKMRELVTKK